MKVKNGKLVVMALLAILLLPGCSSTNETVDENGFEDVSNEEMQTNNTTKEDQSNSSTNDSQSNVSDENEELGSSKDDIINGINQIGYDIIKILYSEDKSENLLFSPISLTSSLAMLENGASGSTKDEIIKVLNIAGDDHLNDTYQMLIEHFEKVSDKNGKTDRFTTTINLANSFWFTNRDIEIKESYSELLKLFYHGDLFSVDFRDEKTKDLMNDWIEDKTNGFIKKVIDRTYESDVSYLINALYFKAQWLNGFYEDNTKVEDFTLVNKEKVHVDMMYDRSKRKYFESGDAQVVALDFSDATMYVILPKEGMESFIENNDRFAIDKIIDNLDYKTVELYLPKFEYSTKNELVDILKILGMTSAFNPETAEFDGMIKNNNEVFVTKIFQNTRIGVDESGVEAAAVTVATVGITSLPEPLDEVIMNCNKPFLILIRDNVTNTDLFLGIVQNPSK